MCGKFFGAPIYTQAAHELGQLLAKNNLKTICGAGQTGLMGALAKGVMAAGGLVEGITPEFLRTHSAEGCQDLSILTVTYTIHQRKELMARYADSFIALPGGCGTLEELLEIITWKQLGLKTTPIIILNIDGYYDPLIQIQQRCVDQKFMTHEDQHLWQVAQTPRQAIELICASETTTAYATDDRVI